LVLAVHRVVNLGREHDAVAPAAAFAEPLADDLLGGALAGLAAVNVSRVEEVDAQVQRLVHDGVAVFLVGPRAEVHRAQAKSADLESGASEVDDLHVPLLRGDGRYAKCSSRVPV